MPPEGWGGYLLNYWHDMGRHGYGAMGPVPLSDVDLRAWSENVYTPLAPWESRLVKDLSRAYLAEMNAAEDPLRAAPYGTLADQFDRAKLSQRLGASLRAMAQSSGKKGKRQ